MNVEFFLSYCDELPSSSGAVVEMAARNSLAAEGLCNSAAQVGLWLIDKGKSLLRIYFPGDNGKPYEFPAGPLMSAEDKNKSDLMKMSNQIELIQDYDYRAFMEWCLRQYDEGKIVTVVSQVNDVCRSVTDLLTPTRAVWTPDKFYGYNYRVSWSIDKYGNQMPDASDEYHEMRRQLDKHGYINDYSYKLWRPGDGAIVSYSTSYYSGVLAGEPIRAGVSRPQDYEVVKVSEPASV